MRMRKKPNLIPRMERCARVNIDDPAVLKGKWLETLPQYKTLWVELGCGKGRFTADTAEKNPEVLLVGIEKVADAMVMGMERVCSKNLENVRFVDMDAAVLPIVFEKNEIDRLFINFCDPWPRSHNAKRRLTAPGFLKIYESVLKPEGEIHFKTDNQPLFEYSVETLKAEGWSLSDVTRDLHENGPVGVMTDYEAKFFEQGVKINRLVAKKERNE